MTAKQKEMLKNRMIAASYQEITELLECFNRDALYTDVEHVLMEPVSKK